MKKQEKDFIDVSFLKVVKTAETCITQGKKIFNTLVILKKDYSVKFIDVCDKSVMEIRDLLPNFEMLSYIYAIECKRVNKHTRKQRKIISIGLCKSNFYMKMDIEFKDKKIIQRKLIKERNDEHIDVLDLWGNYENE